MNWQLAEAKNKLSEVFTRTIEEGPQFVTRRGQEVVIISKDEYQELLGKKPSFIDHLLAIPKVDDLDLTRDPSPMRETEW